MNNQKIIEQFYTAFAAHDVEKMLACYHPDVTFSDPAFGELNSQEVSAMWRMLLERAKGNLKVQHFNVHADDRIGRADWTAKYRFTQTNRPVVNRIQAEFEFQEGRIMRHRDRFDLGQWATQAFGFKGWLISIFPFLQKKLRQNARQSLAAWQAKNEVS